MRTLRIKLKSGQVLEIGTRGFGPDGDTFNFGNHRLTIDEMIFVLDSALTKMPLHHTDSRDKYLGRLKEMKKISKSNSHLPSFWSPIPLSAVIITPKLEKVRHLNKPA